MKKYAPIVLFTYSRPEHIQKTLMALAANTLAARSDLYIFSDAPKDVSAVRAVKEVRAYVHTVSGFASVTIEERPHNFGLADSIIDGVTGVIRNYGRAIILEDDILTSPYFLEYMNTALNRYADTEQVMHIAAHMPSINRNGLPESFFLRQSSCWGWGTWARAWRHFHRHGQEFIKTFTSADIKRFNLGGAYDFWSQLLANQNGSLKTWAVYWYACIFSRNGLCLHPRQSLVQNIGFDGSGENCGDFGGDASVAETLAPKTYPDVLKENKRALRRYRESICGTSTLCWPDKIRAFFTGLHHA